MANPTGSVFINGQSSFSGVDIKAVLHIYDGGKLAEERKNNIQSEIKKLNDQVRATGAKQQELETRLINGSSNATDIKTLNDTNILLAKSNNTLNALIDEYARLAALKPQFSTKVL